MTIRKVSDEMWSKFMNAGQERDGLVTELQELWKTELPGLPLPGETQFQRWLRGSRNPEALVFAMTQAKRRMARESWGDENHHISFISSVNNRRIAELVDLRKEKRRAA